MKRFSVFFTLVLFVLLASSALQAQTGQRHMMRSRAMTDSTFQQGMGWMGQGMHPGMTGIMGSTGMMGWNLGNMGSFYKIFYTINNLPDMAKTLNLTAKETDQLNTLQTDFSKNRVDWNADIQKQMIDLNQAVEKEAPASQVKKIVEGIANTRVEMMNGAYVTYTKMLGVLTPDQKKQFEDLDLYNKWNRQMHHQMMNW